MPTLRSRIYCEGLSFLLLHLQDPVKHQQDLPIYTYLYHHNILKAV